MVHDAFGEDEEQADAAFFQMQKTISAMVAEREEDESLPPVELTAEAVSGLATEAEVPDEVRAQIEKSYEQVFGDQPPQAHNVLDSRLVEEGTVKAHTAALEQKVAVLQQELGASGGKRRRRGRGRCSVGDRHGHRRSHAAGESRKRPYRGCGRAEVPCHSACRG